MPGRSDRQLFQFLVEVDPRRVRRAPVHKRPPVELRGDTHRQHGAALGENVLRDSSRPLRDDGHADTEVPVHPRALRHGGFAVALEAREASGLRRENGSLLKDEMQGNLDARAELADVIE